MKDVLQPLVDQFMPYAQKRMGFNKLPRIFLRDDPQNSQNPLGKTAYYDPAQMSVTLYVTGRHPKDVMRSLSHELIHHTQNCNGQFDGASEMGEGYAQNDEHLREMERQAYEQGNLVFRDWEDSIKGTIYNESLQKGAKKKMSLKDWKNNELRTVLSERWGFSFNLLNESQEEAVEEGMCQQCAPNPCACGTMEEGEEIEEGAASSGRVATPDRAQGGDRREDDERKRPMEEGEKMPMKTDTEDADEDGDTSDKVPAFLDKGETKKKKSKGKQPPQLAAAQGKKKEKMDEQQIRQIIRKLVKEAMAKKAK
jgi:hypothetical protein